MPSTGPLHIIVRPREQNALEHLHIMSQKHLPHRSLRVFISFRKLRPDAAEFSIIEANNMNYGQFAKIKPAPPIRSLQIRFPSPAQKIPPPEDKIPAQTNDQPIRQYLKSRNSRRQTRLISLGYNCHESLPCSPIYCTREKHENCTADEE